MPKGALRPMKRTLFFLIIILLASCKKEVNILEYDIMKEPIVAEDLQDFNDKLTTICLELNEKTCSLIKGPIKLTFPNGIPRRSLLSTDDAIASRELFEKLNKKSPSQIISLYKNMLKQALNAQREQDKKVITTLEKLEETYKKTKKYADQIIVDNITTHISSKRGVEYVNFNLTNKSAFELISFTAEVEFLTGEGTLISRQPSFTKALFPPLEPKKHIKLSADISRLSLEDNKFIKAAKNLQIKVTITQVKTNSQDADNNTLILTLPYAYHYLKEAVEEKHELYEMTLERIKNIN